MVINYDQEEGFPVAFSDSQVVVHPDAQTVQLQLERTGKDMSEALEVVVASEDGTFQKTIKWQEQESKPQLIIMATPVKEVLLKIVSINGQL